MRRQIALNVQAAYCQPKIDHEKVLRDWESAIKIGVWQVIEFFKEVLQSC